MATISLSSIVKRYGATTAVHGIDLDVGEGEFVVLVGPSGCGKSTTLRMIAGLEEISGGTLRIGGQVVNELAPKDRNIAMVFQNYAIYPHMTVAQNIGFGLYTSRLSKAEKEERIAQTAKILSLEPYLQRRPSELSGGQRQRVAIGRAMVRDPAAFLFDEPLSNLDAQLRAQMRLEIKKLHQRLKTTIVYVTHDQVEAMTLADRIVVMRDGRILQVGTPTDLYERPVDVFTARFIGSPAMNLVPASLTEGGASARTAEGQIVPLPALDGGSAATSGEVLIGVRPHDLVAVPAGAAAPQGLALQGRVAVVEPLGAETLLHVETHGLSLIASAPGKKAPAVGETVTLTAATEALYVFDAKTERSLCRR